MIAPHKAILLLAIIDLIERGIITTLCMYSVIRRIGTQFQKNVEDLRTNN